MNPEILALLNKYRAFISRPGCGTVEQQEEAVDILDAILSILDKTSDTSEKDPK